MMQLLIDIYNTAQLYVQEAASKTYRGCHTLVSNLPAACLVLSVYCTDEGGGKNEKRYSVIFEVIYQFQCHF